MTTAGGGACESAWRAPGAGSIPRRGDAALSRSFAAVHVGHILGLCGVRRWRAKQPKPAPRVSGFE